jgi:hypothetical protein
MPIYNLPYYLQQTQELLQNPPANPALYPTQTLTDAINKARLWVAGEAQCIRQYNSLTLAPGQQNAPFAAITTSSGQGVAGVLNVRQAAYKVASGQRFIHPRSFEWFFQYPLNNPNPQVAPFPTVWSQQGQGVSGTFWINPISGGPLVFSLDCANYPIDLLLPTDAEAIPAPWTQCVPFLAAYYALMSAQSSARLEAAGILFKQFSDFMERARNMVTPPTNQYIYAQQADPTTLNALGLSSGPKQ